MDIWAGALKKFEMSGHPVPSEPSEVTGTFLIKEACPSTPFDIKAGTSALNH
jgi:hypothetical protein